MVDGIDTPTETKSSKRRAVSSACIPCRKRKSKCDGGGPSCSTCTAVYRTECFYDQDSDHRRKGALKRDIQSLQQRNDALDVIVASLRALPESDSINLLHSIRSDDNNEGIAASLQTNVRLPHSFGPQTLESEFVQHLTHPDSARAQSDVPSSDPSLSPAHYRPNGEDHPSGGGITYQNPSFWFRTPPDPEFIEHLLDLYFTWVHPFYQLFSQDRFLMDFKRGETGHCSALLVNVICAFGCHYSDRLAARSDADDPLSVGEHFFAEAKRLLDLDEKPSLTMVQALGIMSFRETSRGRDSNGYQYTGRCLRVALEMGLHLSVMSSNLRPAEFEARKITFWGVFNTETICSVGMGRLSQLPRAAADIDRPTLSERSETQPWRPYQDTNAPINAAAEQPGRYMSFVHCLSDLSEIASDMVNTFYAPRERFTSRRLSTTYEAYQNWYNKLPQHFRLEHTSLPQVLVLHMYYYACVLHLFRPYIKLDLRGANLFPRDTCTFCANEISALTNALRAMYGLRRVCLPVTGFLLSASTIHLLNLPSETSGRHLCQAMHDLSTMSTNHVFAGRCVDIIRSLASKWQIKLPEDAPTITLTRPSGRTSNSPKSAFYSASIPRQNSSQSGTRSAESQESQSSNQSHHDSPLAPPEQSSQHNPSSGQYYGDQFPSIDEVSMQQSYWLPFPVQSMPNAQLPGSQVTNTFGFANMHGDSQWQQQHQHQQQYTVPTQTPSMQQHLQQQLYSRQHPSPVHADQYMSHGYDDWHI